MPHNSCAVHHCLHCDANPFFACVMYIYYFMSWYVFISYYLLWPNTGERQLKGRKTYFGSHILVSEGSVHRSREGVVDQRNSYHDDQEGKRECWGKWAFSFPLFIPSGPLTFGVSLLLFSCSSNTLTDTPEVYLIDLLGACQSNQVDSFGTPLQWKVILLCSLLVLSNSLSLFLCFVVQESFWRTKYVPSWKPILSSFLLTEPLHCLREKFAVLTWELQLS
jgi:hypothetical protein